MSRVQRKKKIKPGKTSKSISTKKVLPVLPARAPDHLTDAAMIAREFATWAATQDDQVLVEVKKSAVASQLKSIGVGRGTAILTRAIAAVDNEQENAANAQMIAEMDAAAAAEEAQRRAPAVLAQVKRILQAPN